MGLQVEPVIDSALITLSATMATLYGARIRASPDWQRTIIKATSTALLSLMVVVRGSEWWLAAALALSSLGDGWLSRPGEKAFLGGLASFLSAHVVYITLFARLGGGWESIGSAGWRQVVAVVMVALAASMDVALARATRIGRLLRGPSLIYSTAVLLMVLAALTVDAAQVTVGAVFFALSDSLLAADEFLVSVEWAPRRWLQHPIWILYYCGQLTIASALSRDG